MPITSIDQMRQVSTQEWNDQQREWLPLWTEIQNYGNAFFDQITVNVPLRSERHAYWDFRLNNANKPSTMGGLKVRTQGNVSIYFKNGDDAERTNQIGQFKQKLVEMGFRQNQKENRWTRNALSIEIDGNRGISFAVVYPGNMNDTAKAQWQVEKLIALSQLITELYH